MDEVLMHYGVKGQKWGVRRTPAQLGHKTGAKKSRTTLASLFSKKRARVPRLKKAPREQKLRTHRRSSPRSFRN